MKVLIDSSPLNTGHQHRGIGQYTKQLISALKNEGLEVKTSDEDSIGQVDLVHYPFFDLFKASLPLNWSRKTVVTIHDVIPLEFPNHYQPGVRGSISLLFQELKLKWVNAVITDSEYSKKQIIDNLRVQSERIFVVPLAGNPAVRASQAIGRDQLQSKYKLPKKYILYVGDINYNKNIPELIESLSLVPDDINLVCVGKNFRRQPINEWKAIENKVTEHDLKERVIFLNEIGQDQTEVLAAIYQHALCYIQPSLSEGFGLPVLEAMQCNCPVICTERGSLPEIAGENVLYTDPNAVSFAAGVSEINNWSNPRRTAVVKAAAAWADRFSWRKTAQQTIQVYKQALS